MLRAAVVVVCMLALAGDAAAAARHYDWRIIARSHLIVTAQPKISKKVFEKRVSAESGSYVAVPMRITRHIKGGGKAKSLTVHIQATDGKELAFIRDAFYREKRELITSLTYTEKKYYLLHFWKRATLDEWPPSLPQIEEEVVRQQHILRGWRTDRTLPHFEDVKEIIDRMIDPETEEEAFRELVSLGHAAVPAIIHQMDDRRPLPVRHIELVHTSPQAFESVRHYGPDVVVDALAAILNRITGEHFGFIYNGASDLERDHCVAGWRIYDATVRARTTRERR